MSRKQSQTENKKRNEELPHEKSSKGGGEVTQRGRKQRYNSRPKRRALKTAGGQALLSGLRVKSQNAGTKERANLQRGSRINSTEEGKLEMAQGLETPVLQAKKQQLTLSTSSSEFFLSQNDTPRPNHVRVSKDICKRITSQNLTSHQKKKRNLVRGNRDSKKWGIQHSHE